MPPVTLQIVGCAKRVHLVFSFLILDASHGFSTHTNSNSHHHHHHFSSAAALLGRPVSPISSAFRHRVRPRPRSGGTERRLACDSRCPDPDMPRYSTASLTFFADDDDAPLSERLDTRLESALSEPLELPPCVHHIITDRDFPSLREAICAETGLPAKYVNALADFGAIYVEKAGKAEGTETAAADTEAKMQMLRITSAVELDSSSSSSSSSSSPPPSSSTSYSPSSPSPSLSSSSSSSSPSFSSSPSSSSSSLSSTPWFAKGRYVRVHQNPKRRPQAHQVDWASAVLVNEGEFVVVDKPPGLPLQAGIDNYKENVVFQLRHKAGLFPDKKAGLLSTGQPPTTLPPPLTPPPAPPPDLWVTGRLDATTTGVCVLAKSSQAAARVNAVLKRGGELNDDDSSSFRRKSFGKSKKELKRWRRSMILSATLNASSPSSSSPSSSSTSPSMSPPPPPLPHLSVAPFAKIDGVDDVEVTVIPLYDK